MPWFYVHREGQKKSFLRAPSWAVRSVPGPLAAYVVGTPCLGVIWATGGGFTGKTTLCTEAVVTPLIWSSEVLFRTSGRPPKEKPKEKLDQIKMYQWPRNTWGKEPGRCWSSSSGGGGWPLLITPSVKGTPSGRAYGDTGGQEAYSPLTCLVPLSNH